MSFRPRALILGLVVCLVLMGAPIIGFQDGDAVLSIGVTPAYAGGGGCDDFTCVEIQEPPYIEFCGNGPDLDCVIVGDDCYWRVCT